MGAILDIATGWTLYAALVAMVGACVARVYLIPRSRAGTGDDSLLATAAGRMALLGALLLVPAMGLFFLRQLLEFRDPFVPWTEDAHLLLTGTAWGTTWLRGAGLSLLTLGALALAARGVSGGWWLGGLFVLSLGAFPALTGHASGSDGPRALLLSADVLHVWAAGGWIGGLAFVLHAERGSRKRGAGSVLPRLVPVFSPVAMTCVGALVLTGGVGAWVHLPSFASLVDSSYGRALSLKLLLVAATVGLGFVNWRKLTPRLSDASGPDALRRAATTELILMQVVLAITAVLVRTAPP